MTEPIPNFALDYGRWLTSRLSQQVREGVVEVSTPLLDPLNDGMRVYIETGSNGILVHDGGITIETLIVQGVDIHSTSKRESLVYDILRSSGLSMEGDRIQTQANSRNLPQRMHFLLSAMNRISDLSLTTRQGKTTDFFERVCSYLDECEVLYSTHLSIPGKTVEHPVDIVIPLPRRKERLVRLIGTPNVNTAKIVSFSWIEVAEVRPEAERVIIINDEASGDQDEIKNISQQTESILQGYSTAMYLWSQRTNPEFEMLWRAA
jgi:hypothetical protein